MAKKSSSDEYWKRRIAQEHELQFVAKRQRQFATSLLGFEDQSTAEAAQLLSELRSKWSHLTAEDKEWFSESARTFERDVLKSREICGAVDKFCNRYAELLVGKPVEWPSNEEACKLFGFEHLQDMVPLTKIQRLTQGPLKKLDPQLVKAARVIKTFSNIIFWAGAIKTSSQKAGVPFPPDLLSICTLLQSVALNQFKSGSSGSFIFTRLNTKRLCDAEQRPLIELMRDFHEINWLGVQVALFRFGKRNELPEPSKPKPARRSKSKSLNDLSEGQRALLQCASKIEPRQTPELVELSGYPNNSNTRTSLAHLVKLGFLTKTRRGYLLNIDLPDGFE